MSFIREHHKTPIIEEYDVCVCGGGFGGISAALAAARCGKRVILVEKEYILGGLGTAGLVTIYLPICDGVGHQVSFGIAEELLRLSISMGAEDKYPDNWLDSNDKSKRTNEDKRFEVRYNPHVFAILAEQLLTQNGVDILYGSYAVDVKVKKQKITNIIIENKSGRTAIGVGSVVDATGDCDIAHFAGAPTETFKQGNVLAAWYYFFDKSGYDLKILGFADIPDDQKTESNKVETLVSRRFSGIDGEEISQMVQLSHTSILNDIKKRRETDSTVIPTTIATIPQIRMTRKIRAEYMLHDTEQHKYFDNSIGMVSDWRKRGPVYEIPFTALYSSKIKNLITSGRCIGVTDEMWDITRVIPCCAVTGQAAGTAAALTDDFATLDIKKLQQRLKSDGVILHEKDL